MCTGNTGPSCLTLSILGPSTPLNHRITEHFAYKGTFKGHPVQPPCRKQGHLPLDQVAQSPIQSELKHCQGGQGDTYNSSGQPVPKSYHSHQKKFFLMSNLNLPFFSLKLLALVLSLPALIKRLSPPSYKSPLYTEDLYIYECIYINIYIKIFSLVKFRF